MKTKCPKASGRPLALLFLSLVATACSSTKNPWQNASRPTFSPAEAIGGYSSGCLRGAKSLHAEGRGYLVMRISRKKFYGHPELIDFIETLGKKIDKKHLGPLLIGNLGQPRGGPTLSGHVSHQTGLDVDIWFWQPERGETLTLDQRENLDARSVVSADGESVDSRFWKSEKSEILKITAEDTRVERIFVNPAIKRELCKKQPRQEWLQKIRPWWGHDDHFHVRLRCPKDGSVQCKHQEAVPLEPEYGCGPELDRDWFSAEAKALAKEKKSEAPKMPDLPEACEPVLNEP